MNRYRLPILAAVVVVFLAVGAFLLYATLGQGGKSVTFNVTVTGAKSMNPPELKAHLNDTITINVTSDTDGEVHLHGYDIHFDTKAGQVVSHTFKADKSGAFDIEWEETSAPLGSLVVT